ncbi:hypothetical protein KOR34_00900 [Posidoniimonas corsicana]|uniref:Uncharacterized protein n=1 Tax=Posidoniimonas corsicana TaxID=1938618 RepID=A0A5C5VBV6_9BACT|nr:glycosyltransferase domain-containing protein [Posidoniimonas corsicana]TWT35202.1 hypothetical protein KOR34_00900 [Posidoniimonas corsicana]
MPSSDLRISVLNRSHETTPVHIHCSGMRCKDQRPGGDQRSGRGLFDALLASIEGRTAATTAAKQELEVVTCKTYKKSSPLELSLAMVGSRAVVYQHPHELWHNRLKLSIYLDHCRRSRASFLLLSDSWDAVVLASAEVMLRRFLHFEVDALLSGERVNHPRLDDVASEEQALAKGSYPYGNSGGVIGRREKLIEILRLSRELLPERRHSDQGSVRVACLELGVPRDTRCEFFQNLASVNPGEIELRAES